MQAAGLRGFLCGAAIAALACAAVLGAAAPAGRAAAGGEANVLGARGEGEVSVPPDVAYLRLGVSAQAKQASAAQSAVNEVATRIYAALKKLGIGERDIQTVELQIGPVYANERNPAAEEPRVVGYSASNVVRAKVIDLPKLGAIVDAGLAAGANRVDGIEFALRDDREARKEALRRAVADARAKTAAMAEALGARLGPVRSLQEGGVSAEPRPTVMTRMRMEAASTPTSAGEIVVHAEVTLQYALE